MKNLLLISLVLICSVSYVCSQTNDSTYQKYLMNNQAIPKRIHYVTDNSDILKTDITYIFDGILPLIWEHRFSDNYALGGGLGLIMNYSINELLKSDVGDFDDGVFGFNPLFKNKNFGVMLHLEPKLFLPFYNIFIGDNGKSFLTAIYNYKGYSQLKISELGLGYGYSCDYDKVNFQIIFTAYMSNQYGFNDFYDLKYIGFLSNLNGDQMRSFRVSIGLQIGYNLSSKKMKNPKK